MQLASIDTPRAGDSSARLRDRAHAELADAALAVTAHGWQLARTRGSHRQYKHPAKSGLVTVPGKPSDELHPTTLSSIVKQAGLRGDTGGTGAAGERKET